MNKLRLFPIALTALVLGACSSEDVIDNGGQGPVAPGEKGYVSFAINLPTTAGTRAFDGYSDGTPDEYEVNDATLLLFTGANEAKSTCQGVYSLNVSAFLENPENQITSTAKIVREITKPSDEAGNIYALVVLNRNNVFTVNAANNTGTINNNEPIVGKTFEFFYNTAMTLQASALKGTGFFMTNAPLYSKAGGEADPTDGVVTTLSKVDPDKIRSTEAEALNSPAATVYVERALSKVTLDETNNQLLSGHNENITSYTIAGWVLDNTNNSTYLVRNVAPATSWWGYMNPNTSSSNTSKYRFVDGNPVETDVRLYRTHFGIDPNYDINYNSANFTTVGGSTIDGQNLIAANGTTPAYCLENTFDVAHMTEKNTTRVIVAAKLTVDGAGNGGDFYLLNNNTSVIYSETSVTDAVKSLWMNYLESNKAAYMKQGTFDEGNVDVTLSSAENGGYLEVTALTLHEPNDFVPADDKDFTDLQKAATAYIPTINDNLKIAYYKGGIAYYPVLIKHFGDSETPWTTDNIQNGNSYPDGNESASQKWLGRYGVLRNTWYQLSVTGLRNIGSPEVPEVTDDYDDPGKQYISVDINILPWAVRTQSVEL